MINNLITVLWSSWILKCYMSVGCAVIVIMLEETKKSKFAWVWRRFPQRVRAVSIKSYEEGVVRLWICLEGRRLGWGCSHNDSKKIARQSTRHHFFQLSESQVLSEPQQPGFQEETALQGDAGFVSHVWQSPGEVEPPHRGVRGNRYNLHQITKDSSRASETG